MLRMSRLTRSLLGVLCAFVLVIGLPRRGMALSGNFNCLATAPVTIGSSVFGLSELIHLNLSGPGSTLAMHVEGETCKLVLSSVAAKVDATGQGTLVLQFNGNVPDRDNDVTSCAMLFFSRSGIITVHYLIATASAGTKFYLMPDDDYDPSTDDNGDYPAALSGVCEKSP